MQAATAETYAAHKDILDRFGVSFVTGVALHKGRVAYGGMSTREFTVLGDAVNVAFRMENLTREIGSKVITSAKFLDSWPDGENHCRSLGRHQLKGRAEPVELYAVENPPPPLAGAD